MSRTTILEQVEAAIVARLRERLSQEVRVEAFPAKPSAYDLTQVDLAALVHFVGSRYSAQGAFRQGQGRTLEYAVHLYSRDLRDHRGGYRLIEDARQALQDIALSGGTPIALLSDGLIDIDESGLWHWRLMIATTVPAVPQRALGATGPVATTFDREAS